MLSLNIDLSMPTKRALMLVLFSCLLLTQGCSKKNPQKLPEPEYDRSRRAEPYPKDTIDHVARAKIAEASGDFLRAVHELDDAMDATNPEAAVFYERAKALYALRYYDFAASDLSELIDRGYPWAHRLRGFCYYDLGEYEKALKDFEIQPDSGSISTYSPEAYSSLFSGKFEKAVTYWQKDIDLHRPTRLSQDREISIAYCLAGEFRNALPYADSAVFASQGDTADAYFHKGVILLRLGDTNTGITVLQKVTAPGYLVSLAHAEIAFAYAKASKREQAMNYFSSALDGGFQFAELIEKSSPLRAYFPSFFSTNKGHHKDSVLSSILRRHKVFSKADAEIARERLHGTFSRTQFGEEYRTLRGLLRIYNQDVIILGLVKEDPGFAE